MAPFGSERHLIEPRLVHRVLLQWCGWRQLGPRMRYWHIAQAVKGARPARILEAGCGWGQNLFALQRRFPEATMIGVDVDASLIETARMIAARMTGRQPTFVVGDAHTVALEGGFHLILISDVLEYLADDRQVLRRCREWLAPGGRLVVHVPRRISEQRRILPVSHETPGHARPEYTREDILAKMQAAGFALPQVRDTFGWWGTLAWEGAKLCERIRLVAAVLFPFWLLLARLDLWGVAPRRNGNGYLVIATAG